MISTELESHVRTGAVLNFYGCYTMKWMRKGGCQEFDSALFTFRDELKRIEARSYLQANASAESYMFVLPSDMTPEVLESVIALLRSSEVEFDAENHFGALF